MPALADMSLTRAWTKFRSRAPARASTMNRSRGRQHALFCVAASIVALCGMSSCARVAPYERERLARPDMAFGEGGDVKAGEEHAQAYREASSGGGAAKGGGCGCN